MEQDLGIDSREAGQTMPRALVQPSGPVVDEDRMDQPRRRSVVQRIGENIFRFRSTCGFSGWYKYVPSLSNDVCFLLAV